MEPQYVNVLVEEDKVNISGVHICNVNDLMAKEGYRLINRINRGFHAFNGHTFLTVGVINLEYRGSSLLNGLGVGDEIKWDASYNLLYFHTFGTVTSSSNSRYSITSH